MTELQVFRNDEFGEIRAVEVNGKAWFVAKDVCDVLGITNHRNAVAKLSGTQKGVHTMDTPGGKQEMAVVNEAGIYKIAFTSRKPEAERFTDWVAGEVLPTIRKHGMYATPQTIETMLQDPDTMIRILQELKAERQARLAAERTNAILMHVNKTYTTTEIAKELGFRSAAAFNRDLAEKRIQYKQNNTWVLYSDYANQGYTDIKQEVLDNGKVIYHRRWTQRGREFLLNTYAYKGGQSDAV
jgi:prophage antirepressor-like protein